MESPAEISTLPSLGMLPADLVRVLVTTMLERETIGRLSLSCRHWHSAIWAYVQQLDLYSSNRRTDLTSLMVHQNLVNLRSLYARNMPLASARLVSFISRQRHLVDLELTINVTSQDDLANLVSILERQGPQLEQLTILQFGMNVEFWRPRKPVFPRSNLKIFLEALVHNCSNLRSLSLGPSVYPDPFIEDDFQNVQQYDSFCYVEEAEEEEEEASPLEHQHHPAEVFFQDLITLPKLKFLAFALHPYIDDHPSLTHLTQLEQIHVSYDEYFDIGSLLGQRQQNREFAFVNRYKSRIEAYFPATVGMNGISFTLLISAGQAESFRVFNMASLVSTFFYSQIDDIISAGADPNVRPCHWTPLIEWRDSGDPPPNSMEIFHPTMGVLNKLVKAGGHIVDLSHLLWRTLPHQIHSRENEKDVQIMEEIELDATNFALMLLEQVYPVQFAATHEPGHTPRKAVIANLPLESWLAKMLPRVLRRLFQSEQMRRFYALDPNVRQGTSEKTPLFFACNKLAVDVLADFGADLDARNREGHTADEGPESTLRDDVIDHIKYLRSKRSK